MKNGVKICIFLVAVLCCVCGAVAQDSTGLPIERRMLFNAWLFLPAGSYYASDWVHEGPAPALFPVTRRMLLPGTNHYHSSGWRLTACRTGTSAGTGQNVNFIPPLSYSAVIQTNWQASLQNTLDAKIESPFYPEGIGTLYFDAINVSPSHPTEITVEIATNMLEYIYLGGGVTNVMYPVESEQFSNNWQVLDVLSLNAASSNDFTRYQRLLQCRTPARFRIRRTGTVHSGLISLDDAFTAIDNICASYPPADVVLVRPAVVFKPGYPATGEPCVIRCEVSCVGTNWNERTDHTNRAMTVHYRWRYLDQMSNAWASVPMSYVAGSGVGDGEMYEATLPAQADIGDLEYFFECDFEGYRYRHLDYTGSGYAYTTEWLSPRILRGDTAVEGGREFYTRLRPMASSFGEMLLVVGESGAEQTTVVMTPLETGRWRGIIPLAGRAPTNICFYLRGEGQYDAVADAFLPDPVYWSDASQTVPSPLPLTGTCDSGAVPPNHRIRIATAGSSCVEVLFDEVSGTYWTARAEYQNFNSQTADTDPIQDRDQPFLQSPALSFPLGSLTFMARAYDVASPARIAVYASTNGWDAPAESWFEVHAFSGIAHVPYRTYRFVPATPVQYDAIRLVVAADGSSGRACVDEVVISELGAAGVPPSVKVFVPTEPVSELAGTGAYIKKRLIVRLSEPYAQDVTVRLDLSPDANAQNGCLGLSQTNLVFAAGAEEQVVDIGPLDGTALSATDGFTVTPVVVSPVAAQHHYLSLVAVAVRVLNEAPVIVEPAGGIASLPASFFVQSGQPHSFFWNVTDAAADSGADVGSGMKITWYFGDDTWSVAWGASGTIEHTYANVGDRVVRMIAEDKDGGFDEVQFRVRVATEPVTLSTPVPVPLAWLDLYPSALAAAGGNYESAALGDVDGDGHTTWQEYVTGSDPTNTLSILRAHITVDGGTAQVTWTPDLGPVARCYTVEGKTNLTDGVWLESGPGMRFFRVRVALP